MSRVTRLRAAGIAAVIALVLSVAVVSVPVHAQTPALQTAPSRHALAQVPHALGSVCVFTQPTPGHIVLPAGQAQVPDTQV